MKKPRSTSAPPEKDPTRCLFSTSDSRRCAMPRSPDHSSLCVFHARQEDQLLSAGQIAAELASLSGEFKTATDLNHALGKLFRLVAAQRIPTRNAAVLGYLGQLLLQTLPTVRWESQTRK